MNLSFEQRIEDAHQRAFARPATNEEQTWARETFAELAAELKVSPDKAGNDQTVWSAFCHVMLNRKELIYLF